MVVIQVKRSETDVFLVETSIVESNDALVRRLVSVIYFCLYYPTRWHLFTHLDRYASAKIPHTEDAKTTTHELELCTMQHPQCKSYT